MQRGEIWFAATPGGDRPVLVLTGYGKRAEAGLAALGVHAASAAVQFHGHLAFVAGIG